MCYLNERHNENFDWEFIYYWPMMKRYFFFSSRSFFAYSRGEVNKNKMSMFSTNKSKIWMRRKIKRTVAWFIGSRLKLFIILLIYILISNNVELSFSTNMNLNLSTNNFIFIRMIIVQKKNKNLKKIRGRKAII